MHAKGVNAALPAGTSYSQGSASNAAGEQDLQLAEHQVPVLASGTPALRDALGDQVEYPAQGIIVGKAGLVLRDLTELAVEALNNIRRVCFPDVGVDDLIAFRDQLVAFMYEDAAAVLVYPYVTGLAISYIGVRGSRRGLGFGGRMLSFIEFLAGRRPVFAECVPGSVMHSMLLRRGWHVVPIDYVCPAWGDEAEDCSRDLLCSRAGSRSEYLAFIQEFYRVGYRCDDAEVRMYVERYSEEMSQVCL